ncbi:hypothetical protein D5S19_07220 [Amycolatopsis panacis]|uniref:Uncharacterized protein n=1 Tax=Amycolatopsis panacis TaxID=2340917 RepID=A0A419I7Q6_9PSEU|nr:hypothetical protein D5S19_07220 [Amycolatopsis panacis]
MWTVLPGRHERASPSRTGSDSTRCTSGLIRYPNSSSGTANAKFGNRLSKPPSAISASIRAT